MIMFLEEKVFHVYVILDDFGLYFMSSDTGTKKLFVLIFNYYKNYFNCSIYNHSIFKILNEYIINNLN